MAQDPANHFAGTMERNMSEKRTVSQQHRADSHVFLKQSTSVLIVMQRSQNTTKYRLGLNKNMLAHCWASDKLMFIHSFQTQIQSLGTCSNVPRHDRPLTNISKNINFRNPNLIKKKTFFCFNNK